MCDGWYDIDVPIGALDDVGALGVELRRLAEHLDGHFSHTHKLQQITDTVVCGLTFDDVLDRIFDSFHTVIPYNRMGCALLSEDGAAVRACWARADFDDIRLANGFTGRIAGSSLAHILSTGQPRILNDLEAYLATHPDSHSTRLIVAEGIRSSLTCPLISKGKPIGFLFFSSTESYAYADVHQGAFLRIAAQLSALIEKGRLYQELYELNERLTAAQAELQELATKDALTGIFNRRGILDLLTSQFSKSRRERGQMAVILVDVDHFKRINDHYGHSVGDVVLREIAARLSGHLRQYNHVGRFGGEEFLIVLGDQDCAHGLAIAERLCEVISAQPICHGEHQFDITISAGVARAEDLSHLRGSDALVVLADKALYDAKDAGRNCVAFRSADAATD